MVHREQIECNTDANFGTNDPQPRSATIRSKVCKKLSSNIIHTNFILSNADSCSVTLLMRASYTLSIHTQRLGSVPQVKRSQYPFSSLQDYAEWWQFISRRHSLLYWGKKGRHRSFLIHSTELNMGSNKHTNRSRRLEHTDGYLVRAVHFV